MINKYPSNNQAGNRRILFWLLASFLLLGLVVAASAGAATTYWNNETHNQLIMQREQLENEQHALSKLSLAEEYIETGNPVACIEELRDFPDGLFYQRASELAEQCHRTVAQEWMNKAEAFAANSELKKAVETLLPISGGPLYGEAQVKIEQWSQEIIHRAEALYSQPTDQLQNAIGMLMAIPAESPLFAKAQRLMHGWQTEWANNSRYLQLAQHSLDRKDTATANEAVDSISAHPAWQSRRNEMYLSISEMEHWLEVNLNQATQLLDNNQQQKASYLLAQIPDSSPWAERKQSLLQSEQANTWQNPVVIWMTGAGVTFIVFPKSRQFLIALAEIFAGLT